MRYTFIGESAPFYSKDSDSWIVLWENRSYELSITKDKNNIRWVCFNDIDPEIRIPFCPASFRYLWEKT